MALTVFALVLKVMVPPGFMVADGRQPFLITICTGHGPLVLDVGDAKAPPHKQMDAPCSGAGNVAPPAPPLFGAVAVSYAWVAIVRSTGSVVAVAPGRGLAAPPPPSQGPPLLLS